ncbi:MAG: efflux RND transporter periplasmic adaptor subunit [Alphaproteobacteria bacterium]|nr:efflux RND transporter periplasmic adaptor subunit [Alphaproteobacteria bacterium]
MSPENNLNNPTTQGEADIAATGKKLRQLAAGFVIILAVGFVAVRLIKTHEASMLDRATVQSASTPPAVNTVAAQSAPSTLPLKLPGQTSAWYDSTIYARVDGYVGQWSADIGDHVTKGQVLATLETPDLDAQLAAAQAKLKASQALVEFTQSTYERWKNSPKGVVSDQERAAKKADYDRAVAQQGLDQAELARYQALSQFKQVTAPFDGIVAERHIDIGNLVTAGSTSNMTSLYRIVQDDPMRVFVNVPQSAAGSITDGAAAHVTVDTLPGRVFDGKVARTADAIDRKTRTLRVEVDLPNADHALMPGLYVTVAFDVATPGLVQVPAAALIFKSSGPQVAIIGADGKVDFHNVTIARDNGNTVELSAGVAAGDDVALNISDQVTQGDVVTAHLLKPASHSTGNGAHDQKTP